MLGKWDADTTRFLTEEACLGEELPRPAGGQLWGPSLLFRVLRISKVATQAAPEAP